MRTPSRPPRGVESPDAAPLGDRLYRLRHHEACVPRASGRRCRSSRCRRFWPPPVACRCCGGTHCVVSPDASDLDDMVDRACRIALQEQFGKPGERIIVTRASRARGATNMLRIAYIADDKSN